jgi:hypothetical protein
MANSVETRIRDISENAALLVGVVFAFLLTSSILIVLVYVPATSRLAVASLCALAGLVFGVLIGFLFGIPRVRTSGDVPDPAAVTSVGNRLDVNTNLEQISDWLTKIIVGVGLVQLRSIPQYFDQLTSYMAVGLGICGHPCLFGPERLLSGAIVVFFPSFGFLIGYVVTRVVLAPIFGDAQKQ